MLGPKRSPGDRASAIGKATYAILRPSQVILVALKRKSRFTLSKKQPGKASDRSLSSLKPVLGKSNRDDARR